jgi:putative ABC transport system permease protein
VDTDLADKNGWQVGDEVNVTWRTGQSKVEVVALYKPVLVFTGFLTDYATVTTWGAPPGQDTAIYLKLAEGANAEKVRRDVEQVLQKYPAVGIQDQTEIKKDLQEQINQLLRFIFALLGLAIIIAVLGIVNTLLLSVVERTRELGLLRAVGGSRSQVRRMIVLEALMLGVFGAAIGVVLGVLYGVLMQRTLETEGLTTLSIPYLTLLLFILAGAIAGALAAIWPATSASRLNILKAISSE